MNWFTRPQNIGAGIVNPEAGRLGDLLLTIQYLTDSADRHVHDSVGTFVP